MKTLLTVIAVAMVVSCSDSSVDKGVSDTQHKSLHWTSAMLEGYTLELLNDSDTLKMSFNSDNNIIDVNSKSGEDYAIGYAWHWNITDDGQLGIFTTSSRWVNTYKLTNYSDGLLVVESYGTKSKSTFKRCQTEAKQAAALNP